MERGVMPTNVVRYSRDLERAAPRLRVPAPVGSAEIYFFPDRSTKRRQGAVEGSSDEALLRLIAAGEQSAMRMLFTRHKLRVFRFALSIIKDRSLAEEVVSDVFFDVWRHPGSFEARSTFSTWLLAITRHKAISSLRRHAQERSHEELTETIEDSAEDPEAALQRKQRILLLSACLRRLPPGCREVIDLVYYHRKTIRQVADILQIPVNTVKSRMFWARKRISEIGRPLRTPGLENGSP
jgi:RNA polymerase sigma-70 factor (ECF subfamily)